MGFYGLEDQVFVVTGGSRGIGFEIARALLGEQARVVICGRKQDGLDAAVSQLGGGDRLLAVQAHTAREEDVERLFNEAVRIYGRIDGLINNVGMNLFTPALADTELSVWNKIMEGNLTGAFLCARKAAKLMRPNKSGKMVNISSLAGTRATLGMSVYGVAKAGLEMMTKVMAYELAAFNIQVNAVAPGLVRTDFSRPFWSNDEIVREVVKTIPAGRIAEKEDVAPIVLFLCSPVSSYITGQTLMIDGGSSVI
jgi:NAD(P)-dependent dehydrogenase (short-subunit alcohol dehydrogenase family)